MRTLLLFLLLVSATFAAQAQYVALFTDEGLEGDHITIKDHWDGTNRDFRPDIESIYVPQGWEV